MNYIVFVWSRYWVLCVWQVRDVCDERRSRSRYHRTYWRGRHWRGVGPACASLQTHRFVFECRSEVTIITLFHVRHFSLVALNVFLFFRQRFRSLLKGRVDEIIFQLISFLQLTARDLHNFTDDPLEYDTMFLPPPSPPHSNLNTTLLSNVKESVCLVLNCVLSSFKVPHQRWRCWRSSWSQSSWNRRCHHLGFFSFYFDLLNKQINKQTHKHTLSLSKFFCCRSWLSVQVTVLHLWWPLTNDSRVFCCPNNKTFLIGLIFSFQLTSLLTHTEMCILRWFSLFLWRGVFVKVEDERGDCLHRHFPSRDAECFF